MTRNILLSSEDGIFLFCPFVNISDNVWSIDKNIVLGLGIPVINIFLVVARQPYMGRRSQEKLKSTTSSTSLVTTPAQRLAVSSIK